MFLSPGCLAPKKPSLSRRLKPNTWHCLIVADKLPGCIHFWGSLAIYTLKPIPICGDNQGLIFIASNPVTEKRLKHIDIHYHYIHKVICRKIVEVYFIEGEENPADLLTKNLGVVKFKKFRAMFGLEFF